MRREKNYNHALYEASGENEEFLPESLNESYQKNYD